VYTKHTHTGKASSIKVGKHKEGKEKTEERFAFLFFSFLFSSSALHCCNGMNQDRLSEKRKKLLWSKEAARPIGLIIIR
jgi:hypothetical protein